MPLLRGYRKDLIEGLRHPSEAAEYLNAALEDGDCATLLQYLAKRH